MVVPRWELKIGSTVLAAGMEEYGRLQHLILDLSQKRVLALVVRRKGLHPTHTVVIPIEMVADATEKEVRLQIAIDQVDALPEYQPSSLWSNPDPSVVTIRGRQQLSCIVDNPVGKVAFILSDPDGNVSDIVGQVGTLPRRNLIVPVGWIAGVDFGTVYLSVWENMLEGLPEYRSDDALEIAVDHALWSNETLRNTDYKEIKATIQDGTVYLRGHAFNALNKGRAEESIRSIPGILSIENDLVVDEELVIDVARAIAPLELSPTERIFVNAHHGFITLTGLVNNERTLEAAGIAAASVPRVRGVANFLQAPGVVVHPHKQEFWQPCIGEDVYATDILLGHVEQVVIDPNNRCVTSFVTHGNFPDSHQTGQEGLPEDALLQERDVVLPTSTILYDGESSLRLMVSGVEAAQYPEVSSSGFVCPPAGWQPPYPYDPVNVLFDRNCSAETKELVLNQSYEEGICAR